MSQWVIAEATIYNKNTLSPVVVNGDILSGGDGDAWWREEASKKFPWPNQFSGIPRNIVIRTRDESVYYFVYF